MKRMLAILGALLVACATPTAPDILMQCDTTELHQYIEASLTSTPTQYRARLTWCEPYWSMHVDTVTDVMSLVRQPLPPEWLR